MAREPSFHCEHCGLSDVLIQRFYSDNHHYLSFCAFGDICHWLDGIELEDLIEGCGEGVEPVKVSPSGSL